MTVLCGKGRGRTQGMFGETQDYHLRIGSKDGKPNCSPRRYMYTGASFHLAGVGRQGAGRSGRGMGSSAAASAGRRRWRGSGASQPYSLWPHLRLRLTRRACLSMVFF